MLTAQELLSRISNAPTPWHVVADVGQRLERAGFARVAQSHAGPLPSGNWFTCRNGSSLLAFRVPEAYDPQKVSLRITASHGDSPCFRLKPNGVLRGPYTRLNLELYGGGIHFTWTDTPLALAGRVMVRQEDGIVSKLFYKNEPVAVIPNTAIHLRDMNGGLVLDPKCDLVPLFGGKDADLTAWLAEALDVAPHALAGWDLSLVVPGTGQIFGPQGEFMISPRLDDLECVYTGLDGFLSAQLPENVIGVYAVFDNEETGSLSLAGAAGTVLKDAIARLLPDEGVRQGALARSFFVSADNAHALHPNHPELYDGQNAPLLNGGVVVKYNASQRYMTDGFSGAVFSELCRKAGVPVQTFVTRSDKRSGGTLGNLSEAQVPVWGVDIGAPQLAMHSARETAGCLDVEYMAKALCAFYSEPFSVGEAGVFWNK